MPPETSTQDPVRILVTGHRGLIGSALRLSLLAEEFAVQGLDLRGAGDALGDVRNPTDVRRAIEGCNGVVHLAAVSRVIDGERDPDACWQTNVEGTRNVLDAAGATATRPWVLYASSREVYGQPEELPTPEDAPRVPVNIYGRSKIAAEDLTAESDLQTAIVRFSNVYGSTLDHADRVVPAFARQAAFGLPMRVDGRNHTFDFTHLDDTVRGVMAMIGKLMANETLPPLHLLTGEPTTLGELADLAVELAGSDSPVREAPPRNFDVSTFFGDTRRAAEVLDWRARVSIRQGLSSLIDAFRASGDEGVK